MGLFESFELNLLAILQALVGHQARYCLFRGPSNVRKRAIMLFAISLFNRSLSVSHFYCHPHCGKVNIKK